MSPIAIFQFSKSSSFRFFGFEAFLRECVCVLSSCEVCSIADEEEEVLLIQKKTNFYIYNNSFTPGDVLGLIDLSEIPLHTDLQPK